MVSLREVTRDNLHGVLFLNVRDDQAHFVASNAVSIAQAHFHPDTAWFRAIYADETPVGFAMLEVDREKCHYFLWRFMIGAEFQHLGFGRQAIALLVAHVKTLPNATGLSLSYVPGEGSAGAFYERVGFVATGEQDGGELIMRMEFERA